MLEKMPRHYAQEILACKSNIERGNILDTVPDKYRDWVIHYVDCELEMRKTRPLKKRRYY